MNTEDRAFVEIVRAESQSGHPSGGVSNDDVRRMLRILDEYKSAELQLIEERAKREAADRQVDNIANVMTAHIEDTIIMTKRTLAEKERAEQAEALVAKLHAVMDAASSAPTFMEARDILMRAFANKDR